MVKVAVLEFKVASIIVTFNPIVSLLTENHIQLASQLNKVFIIDNHSENFHEISEAFFDKKNVEVISLNENAGLAAAQNLGLKKSMQEGFHFAILFDQDSILDKNGVKKFIHAFEENESLVAIGPSFYDHKTGNIFPPTKFIGPFISFPFNKSKMATLIPVDFVIASGCMIKLDSLKNIGFMKEDLFIDYIDVEWSYRARAKGYKLLMHREVTMSHQVGDSRANLLFKSVALHGPLRRYYLFRNFIIISKLKYISFGYKLREFCFNVGRFFISLFFTSNKSLLLKLTYQAVKDGFTGNAGKY